VRNPEAPCRDGASGRYGTSALVHLVDARVSIPVWMPGRSEHQPDNSLMSSVPAAASDLRVDITTIIERNNGSSEGDRTPRVWCLAGAANL